MIWLTRLRAWWERWCEIRRYRRALIEGDPRVKRMLEERGVRNRK